MLIASATHGLLIALSFGVLGDQAPYATIPLAMLAGRIYLALAFKRFQDQNLDSRWAFLVAVPTMFILARPDALRLWRHNMFHRDWDGRMATWMIALAFVTAAGWTLWRLGFVRGAAGSNRYSAWPSRLG